MDSLPISGSQVFIIFLAIFAVATVFRGVRIVPQGEEWIIERLGKYNGTFMPGLNFMIPYLDRVSARVVTRTSCSTCRSGSHHQGQCSSGDERHRLREGHEPREGGLRHR